MDSQQIAVIFAKINAKLDILKIFKERLMKVEATREPPKSLTGDQIPSRNNQHKNTDNLSNPNAQYLKSIKINVPKFDRRHDLLLFIYWTLQLDRYFTCYELIESREVKYIVMKLSSQY